jgi:ribosomal-protein-alanine acetyltransferase
MTATLRAGEAADVSAIVAIEREAFTDAWDTRAFQSLLRAPAVRLFVLEEGGELLGYALISVVADEAELANLAVRRDRRGEGFGRRLLDHALAEARAAGVEAMFLEVRASNAAARALYASAGFVAVGRRARYYRDPDEDAVVMRWRADAVGLPDVG